eukprot:6197520-Pleurochrysis_carterae.AAC.1
MGTVAEVASSFVKHVRQHAQGGGDKLRKGVARRTIDQGAWHAAEQEAKRSAGTCIASNSTPFGPPCRNASAGRMRTRSLSIGSKFMLSMEQKGWERMRREGGRE